MKPFKGFDRSNTYKEREELPKGAYILEIKDATMVSGSYGDTLKISFDIAEGDKAGFYVRNYKAQPAEDKKWKGTFRLSIPAQDGSERDQWRVKAFNTAIVAIEESNPGFMWEWDEDKLKGKMVGGLFNRREYEINGRNGWYTQCKRFVTVEAVKTENYKLPDDESLAGRGNVARPSADSFMTVDSVDDEDLPFA